MLGIGHRDLRDGDSCAVSGDSCRDSSPPEGLSPKFANGIPLLTLTTSPNPLVGRPPALNAFVGSRYAGHSSRLGERTDVIPFFSHLVSRVRFPTVPCPSGRRSMSRKHVWVQVHRGFKSHRHRQSPRGNSGAFSCPAAVNWAFDELSPCSLKRTLWDILKSTFSKGVSEPEPPSGTGSLL